MTYTKRNWSAPTGAGSVAPTAKEMGNIDNTLFDQDARVTVLEAALIALAARVTVLENA